MLSGSIPETLIIGVPEGLNGTVCPTNPDGSRSCSQRVYEFTPTECDSAVNNNCSPSGGGPITLDFIWDTIIPSVILKLGMDLGEVSIVGYRYTSFLRFNLYSHL